MSPASAPTPKDWQDARERLGPGAQYLASGVMARVFTDGRRALRLARADAPGLAEHGPRFQVDAQLRRHLRAADVPVPEPLEVGTMPGGRAYSLDELCPHMDAGPPSAQGWADLGRALAALHALPHTGHGLLEDRPDTLRGVAPTPEGGVLTRCRDAWPLSSAPLGAHPLVWAAPDLSPTLAALEGELRGGVQRPAAVCHTDLHAGQMGWAGGRLAALLDFGDAGAFPPEWDVASVACFHGWEVAGRVAHAAGMAPGRTPSLLGVLLGLHRAARARDAARLAGAVSFTRACLSRLA